MLSNVNWNKLININVVVLTVKYIFLFCFVSMSLVIVYYFVFIARLTQSILVCASFLETHFEFISLIEVMHIKLIRFNVLLYYRNIHENPFKYNITIL